MILGPADEIWLNGKIETLDPANPRAQALAVRDGRLLAVGSDVDIEHLTGPRTKRHNLGGKAVLPGLVESHTHAIWGACRELFDVFVGYQASFDELLEAVQDRAGKLDKGCFILGGPWHPNMRAQMGTTPRKILDQIAPTHPVALMDITQHSLWCNTLALNLAGITKTSPDVPGGVIERDSGTNEPTGVLAENACGALKKLMKRSQSQTDEAVEYAVKYLNQFGFTGFKEPMAFEDDLRAYQAADERGKLTLHAGAHIVRTSPFSPEAVSYDELERLRKEYASGNFRTNFAKLFLDGVAPSFTASFLEPYLESAGYDATNHNPDATLLMPPEEINKTVTNLDRRGFVLKMHAVGDNAVRSALNGIETARRENGDSGLRHEVSHNSFIHADDIQRFSKLNAIAEMSPKLWFPNPATAGQIAVLGAKRANQSHPIGDLLKAGAELTYASDWPAAAPDANPWTGLAGMLDRKDATGKYSGTVGADQSISLQQALPLFTINGARSLGMENDTGNLRAGKWADFIVLNDALSDLTPLQIGAIEVRQTYWKGKRVH